MVDSTDLDYESNPLYTLKMLYENFADRYFSSLCPTDVHTIVFRGHGFIDYFWNLQGKYGGKDLPSLPDCNPYVLIGVTIYYAGQYVFKGSSKQFVKNVLDIPKIAKELFISPHELLDAIYGFKKVGYAFFEAPIIL